jgi:hypothetical protein
MQKRYKFGQKIFGSNYFLRNSHLTRAWTGDTAEYVTGQWSAYMHVSVTYKDVRRNSKHQLMHQNIYNLYS